MMSTSGVRGGEDARARMNMVQKRVKTARGGTDGKRKKSQSPQKEKTLDEGEGLIAIDLSGQIVERFSTENDANGPTTNTRSEIFRVQLFLGGRTSRLTKGDGAPGTGDRLELVGSVRG